MQLDLSTDISAIVALYLVRAMTHHGVITTDTAGQVLATTAGWLEQIENEFSEFYGGTRELAEISRRAVAAAAMLREQGLAITYGAALAFDRKRE